MPPSHVEDVSKQAPLFTLWHEVHSRNEQCGFFFTVCSAVRRAFTRYGFSMRGAAVGSFCTDQLPSTPPDSFSIDPALQAQRVHHLTSIQSREDTGELT